MVIVRATRKLLQRLGRATAASGEESTTLLGDWYATFLPWRPRHVALLVSEHTLLPVLMHWPRPRHSSSAFPTRWAPSSTPTEHPSR